MKRLLATALALTGTAALVGLWWQFGWKPAMVGTAVRNEPLALTAMDHVRRALFDPAAMFNGVRYFEASQAACGEVTWHANSVTSAGHTFFVAYPGGFVRLARDMAPADFMKLVQRDCPDSSVIGAAAKVISQPRE